MFKYANETDYIFNCLRKMSRMEIYNEHFSVYSGPFLVSGLKEDRVIASL